VSPAHTTMEGMSTQRATRPPPPEPSIGIGVLLREWRSTRHLSQLSLALDSGVSARHISFIETGRSQPSREMVLRLAEAMDIPLRERNVLLVAAGYAACFPESPLEAGPLQRVRRAVELMLDQQEPYPAFVIDRYWELVMSNDAAERLFRYLRGVSAHTNVVHQVFDPDDMRAVILNWEEVAGDLVQRLQEQLRAMPSDERTRDLLEAALSYHGSPTPLHGRSKRHPEPLLPLVFGKGEREFRFYSTITTFGAPRYVTLDELHIESWFPADDETAHFCHDLADDDS
jgi:transcriptional regulator with XRE-family HTH domain